MSASRRIARLLVAGMVGYLLVSFYLLSFCRYAAEWSFGFIAFCGAVALPVAVAVIGLAMRYFGRSLVPFSVILTVWWSACFLIEVVTDPEAVIESPVLSGGLALAVAASVVGLYGHWREPRLPPEADSTSPQAE